jgi:hypothetical protein
MGSQVIPSAMFVCPHCGQTGVLWELPPDSLGRTLPRVSNGFHLEDGRKEREGSVLVVCNHCDEFQMLDNPKGSFR